MKPAKLLTKRHVKKPFHFFSTIASNPTNVPPVSESLEKRFGWGSDLLDKHIPLTSELFKSKNQPFEMIAVHYYDKTSNSTKFDESSSNDTKSLERPMLRRVYESWLEVVLPFSTHSTLRRDMIRVDGHSVRLGKLIEVMDALASDVSYRHCGTFAPVIVTASVENCSTRRSICVDHDLRLRAYLTSVGRSSMEVNIELMSDTPTEVEAVGTARFIMVARDRVSGKAYEVPDLVLEDGRTRLLYEQGRQRTADRRMRAAQSLTITAPHPEETDAMHALHLESKKLQQQVVKLNNGSCNVISSSSNVQWMANTVCRNTMFMHFQNRNTHGKVFGGFLMKQGYELARATAMRFYAHEAVTFLGLEDVQFVRPVSLGSLVDLTAQVVYTQGRQLVVHVTAEATVLPSHRDWGKSSEGDISTTFVSATDSESDQPRRDITNTFVILFEAPGELHPRRVMPREYEEFLRYLDGRRILLKLNANQTNNNI